MASFAKLDENNVVTAVVAVKNDVITDENGIEQENLGIEFLRNLYNEPNAKWVQTSYNTKLGVHELGGTPLRMNFAEIDGTYDEERDMFIGSRPGVNYVVDYTYGTWKPTVGVPTVLEYEENGETKSWHVYFEDENARWLGFKEVDQETSHVWNETTSTWDLL